MLRKKHLVPKICETKTKNKDFYISVCTQNLIRTPTGSALNFDMEHCDICKTTENISCCRVTFIYLRILEYTSIFLCLGISLNFLDQRNMSAFGIQTRLLLFKIP